VLVNAILKKLVVIFLVGEYFIKRRIETRSMRLMKALAYTGTTAAMSVKEVCQDTIAHDYSTGQH
jgi:hypothetical protein